MPGELRSRSRDVARRASRGPGSSCCARRQTRRIPYWFRVATPRLPAAARARSRRTGTYSGSTVGRPRRVDRVPLPRRSVTRSTAPSRSSGHARAGRRELRRRVLQRRRRSRASSPATRTGSSASPALPLNINPYVRTSGDAEPVAGAIRPAAGRTTSSSTRDARGAHFTFRFWVDDVRAPTARLLDATARRRRRCASASPTRVRRRPALARATVDGDAPAGPLRRRRREVDVGPAASGRTRSCSRSPTTRRRRTWRTSPRILPNTRALRDDLLHDPPSGRSRSSIVGRRSRSRSTLAANSSLSVRTSRRCEALRRFAAAAERPARRHRAARRGAATPRHEHGDRSARAGARRSSPLPGDSSGGQSAGLDSRGVRRLVVTLAAAGRTRRGARRRPRSRRSSCARRRSR